MVRKHRIGCGGLNDYWELCKESEGFDVNAMGRSLSGGVVECDKSDKEDTADAIMLAKFAVDDYNEKNHNSDLRYVSLIKYNGQVVGGMMYYITFKVRSRTLQKTSVYQAKVWLRIKGDPIVKIFREKPKPAIPVPKGAFLCFMNKLAKIPQLSDWTRRDQISLASRAWKNISTEGKLRYYSKQKLDYQDIARFAE